MDEIVIPERVVNHFSISNIPVEFSLSEVADENSQIGQDVRTLLKKVDSLLYSTQSEPPFWFTLWQGLDFDTRRLCITERLVSEAIAQRRLAILSEDYETESKRPYNHSSLEGLKPDRHGLVNLTGFNWSSFPGLKRKQTVFEILPSIPTALHSMYWVMGILLRLNNVERLVRLDPLIRQKESDYSPLMYKMLVYGKPLDWDSIASIRVPVHARFQPDVGWQEDIQFTDLVWSPIGEGIEFVCEEVPKISTYQVRPSRYFHALFVPNRQSFIHCDGAIRIYTEESLQERLKSHVRNIGKIGKRIKVFAVNGDISTEIWTSLVSAYFVWNRDIEKYFQTGGNN